MLLDAAVVTLMWHGITLVWREALMRQVVALVVHICCSLNAGVRPVCSVVFDDWWCVLGVSVVLRVACYCCVAGCRAAFLTVTVHVWCVW